MSDYIFQDHRGQSFEQAFSRGLDGTIIASGFEPRDRSYQGRFWWGVGETADGTMEVFCGRVSNFQDGGWAYKIEGLEYWGGSDHNPPVKVRKEIVKHGLRVKGVYNPDSDDNKFAVMLRGDLLTKVTDAILNTDDAFLLEVIPHVGSDATRAYMRAFHDECNVVMRKPPKVSTAVLRAIAANADRETATWLMITMRERYVELDSVVADTIYPLLKESSQEQLAEMFPHMSAQQAA